MAFFKFLKKERKAATEELDLPPVPPPLEDFDQPPSFDFPDLDKEKLPEAEEPSFEFPEAEPQADIPEEMPEFSIPEEEMPASIFPSISAPSETAVPEQISEEPELLETTPKIEKSLYQERRILPTRREVYVNVNQFRAVVSDINEIRRDLRSSDEALIKLESIKTAKEKSFEKVKSQFDDLQKKLIFIDKTIFKGE